MLRSLVAPLLMLSAAFLMTAPADATLFADARIRENIGFANVDICGGVSTPFATASCSVVDGFSGGEARARAQYGSLGTYALLFSDQDLPYPNDNYQAYGRATWSDSIGFGSPLLTPGQTTDARLTFEISGSGERTPPDFLDGGSLFVTTTFRVVIAGREVTPSNGEFSIYGPGTYYYDFDFIYGGQQMVPIYVEMVSDVRCSTCGGPYRGLSDYLNTAVLDQVEIVGLSPDSYTVSSGEGQSYANVVPEPGTGLLVGGGLLVLSAARRRATRRR